MIASAGRRLPSSFIGRQPIFDSQCSVYGYELFFRSSFENCARILDRDFASAEVALDAFLDFGLDTLVGDRRAFVNVTRAVLLSGLCWQWPRERVVLEILEDVPCDDEVVREVEALASSGYRIALDDFVFREGLRRVLPFASLVKIDISAFTAAALRTQLESLEAYPAALVAERVETPANLDDCRELGFTYFQGFFFARPIVLQGRRIPIERLTALRVLALLADDEAPLGPLVAAIAAPSDSWDRS